jgi:hypothetical protein
VTKPLSPSEVHTKAGSKIPEEVIGIFNDLILENYDGKKSVVKQKDAITRIQIALGHLDVNWLNVETMYENVGWKVVYDKPAYNESYDSTFTFSRQPSPPPRFP